MAYAQSLRAVVFDIFGPPDVLKIVDLPIPSCKTGEVLVKIYAAGVEIGLAQSAVYRSPIRSSIYGQSSVSHH